jgi:hypothetical protein
MGTTLTAVAVSNDGQYVIANVGDSRTYLYREGRLRRLTRDQSLVQALIDRGMLSEQDARRHPQRPVVLEALDGVQRPLPPLQLVQARPGDRLLLCSDGVSDYVTDRELRQALITHNAAVAVREIAPLTPVMVSVLVPPGVAALVFTCSDVEEVAGFGVNCAVAPDGRPVTLNVMSPLKPASGVMPMA